jgi:hypothetical protein
MLHITCFLNLGFIVLSLLSEKLCTIDTPYQMVAYLSIIHKIKSMTNVVNIRVSVFSPIHSQVLQEMEISFSLDFLTILC